MSPSLLAHSRTAFYLHFFHSFNFLREKKSRWRLSRFSHFIVLPSLFATAIRLCYFDRFIFTLIESSSNLLIHIGELGKLLFSNNLSFCWLLSIRHWLQIATWIFILTGKIFFFLINSNIYKVEGGGNHDYFLFFFIYLYIQNHLQAEHILLE